MKKTLSTIFALVLALALALGCVSFAAAESAEAAPGAVGYLMYADGSWAYQYWGDAEAPEGVTPINADITGAGEYTVGLEFAEEAAGLVRGMIRTRNAPDLTEWEDITEQAFAVPGDEEFE